MKFAISVIQTNASLVTLTVVCGLNVMGYLINVSVVQNGSMLIAGQGLNIWKATDERI